MAVVNTLGTIVTNADASPPVHTPANRSGNKVRAQQDTVAKAAGDSDTSTFRVGRIFSSDVLVTMTLFNDALTGATDIDVGLYDTAANGGAAIDADCYADGISLASASTAGTSLTFKKRNITTAGQAVWQDAGLSSDPQKWMDVVVTANTAGGAAGDISLISQYATNQ